MISLTTFRCERLRQKPRHIAVEGPIGVGKTTLVRALSRRLNAAAVYEVFKENPFLSRFYGEPERYAFHTEMFFLLNRFHQLGDLSSAAAPASLVVSDYLFQKCQLFAEMTLSAAELDLFSQVYSILEAQAQLPDLVIHLHAPLEQLQQRIAERGRSYEQGIEPSYLEELNDRYHRLFSAWTGSPVISIDTADLDLRDEQAVEALIDAFWPKNQPLHENHASAAGL